MKFIVIEIQASDTVATIVDSYDTENEALAKYYSILAAAAVGSVPCHSAVIMHEDGMVVKNECIRHEVEA